MIARQTEPDFPQTETEAQKLPPVVLPSRLRRPHTFANLQESGINPPKIEIARQSKVWVAERVSLECFKQGVEIAQKTTVTLYLSQHFTQRSALEQGETT